MSLGINLPFDNAPNYLFDSDDIEVSEGKAQLKLKNNPGQDFNQPFDSGIGFIYDSNKSEFSEGNVQQKDQRPSGYQIFDSYSDADNANWGTGTLTRILSGGAAIVGGELDLTGGTPKKCTYNSDNFLIGGELIIDMKIKPGFSGAAPETCYLLEQATGAYIRIYLSTGGFTVRILETGGGSYAINRYVAKADWVEGQQYRFILFVKSGDSRCYIDGIEQWTDSGIFSKDVNSTSIYIGNSSGSAYNSYFKFDDIYIGTDVGTYATDTVYLNTIYAADQITLPEMEYAGAGALVSADSFVTIDANSPLYCIQIGRSGEWLYHNGAAWVAGDGITQGNTEADFLANITTLPVLGEIYIQFRILTFDGNNQMNVSDLTIGLTAQIYDTNNPSIEPNTAISADQIITFVETVNKSGSDDIRYVIKVNGVRKYWNGSAVADSSGYAQSNTAEEIQANGSEFTGVLIPVIYLHSNDGTTTPNIDNLAYTYDYNPPAIDVTVVNVYGYIYKSDGQPDTEAKVKITVPELTEGATTNINVPYQFVEIEADEDGGWETDLILSSLLGDVEYIFEFIPSDGKKQTQSKIVRDIHGTGQVKYGEL